MQIITIEIFRTMEPACFGIQTYLSTKEEAKPVRISVFLYLYSCIATLKNSTFEILQQAGAPKYRRRATLWAVTLSDFPPSQCQLTLVLGSPQIQYNGNRNTYTHIHTHKHSNTKTIHCKDPAHSCPGPSPQIKHNLKRNTRLKQAHSTSSYK